MKLELICGLSYPGEGGDVSCADGSCPTVYRTHKGTFVIQGYKISNSDKEQLTLPATEDAVEIPANLLDMLLKAMRKE